MSESTIRKSAVVATKDPETNWLGITTEGYGFSNDATGVVGAPSFSAVSFPYDGQNLELTMSLHY